MDEPKTPRRRTATGATRSNPAPRRKKSPAAPEQTPPPELAAPLPTSTPEPPAGAPVATRQRKRGAAVAGPEAPKTEPRPPRRRAAKTARPGGAAGARATPALAPPEPMQLAPPPPTPSEALRVVIVASEVLPFSKSGGLADVSAALGASLGDLGHEVTIVTPRYRATPSRAVSQLRATIMIGGEAIDVRFLVEPFAPRVRVVLVDCPRLFDRDGLYGVKGHDFGDNPLRFALLAKAALVFADLDGVRPHVFHVHDWQCGLLPVYLRTQYHEHPTFAQASVVLTIHNLAYQGTCSKDWVPRLDLDWRHFTVDGFELWDQLSFLKAGVNFCDRITTVSPTYAREILTPAFGFGFEGILARRSAALEGILNGIDTADWNPATDPRIPKPYSVADLRGKRTAKQVLLETYGLPADDAALATPVVGMIARMVAQKGLDLIAANRDLLPSLDARFVVLGTGDRRYEEFWLELARAHPDRIAVRVGFDEDLAHLIEAGADLFLMPSRFEPCGLNQMYSLRYGTLPLVRATGGLDDTVVNYDPRTGEGTGFKFWEYSAPALAVTLRWALATFRAAPADWQRMQRAAMATDFSWAASAREYVRVYGDARAARGFAVA